MQTSYQPAIRELQRAIELNGFGPTNTVDSVGLTVFRAQEGVTRPPFTGSQAPNDFVILRGTKYVSPLAGA